MNLWEYAAKQEPQEAQEPQQAQAGVVPLQRAQERRTEEQERALEICREYQANTRRSEAAQTAILKGLQSGGNPYRLLVTACECIGSLTSNKAFSEMARADIEAIHGAALQQPEALEMELEGIEARLSMLTRPELEAEPEDTRRRVKAAIRAHRQRAGDIVRIIQQRREIIERERENMAARAAHLERLNTDPEYRAEWEARMEAISHL